MTQLEPGPKPPSPAFTHSAMTANPPLHQYSCQLTSSSLPGQHYVTSAMRQVETEKRPT